MGERKPVDPELQHMSDLYTLYDETGDHRYWNKMVDILFGRATKSTQTDDAHG